MELYQAVILGIIQGLTEFLPVSSSGHLVLFQQLLGLNEPDLAFDISLHMGTLFAVLIIYRVEVINICRSLYRFIVSFANKENPSVNVKEDSDLRLFYLMIIGTIPTGIIGLFFHHIAERIFSSVIIVGVMLLITGTVLWLTRKFDNTSLKILDFSGKNAFIIGVVQGLAVIPGISRSGSTIAAGLFLGLERETAAKYSFLLSIPAITAAEILALSQELTNGFTLDMATVCGTMVSFATGYFALTVLLAIVKQGRFYLFSPYCWSVGLLSILVGYAIL